MTSIWARAAALGGVAVLAAAAILLIVLRGPSGPTGVSGSQPSLPSAEVSGNSATPTSTPTRARESTPTRTSASATPTRKSTPTAARTSARPTVSPTLPLPRPSTTRTRPPVSPSTSPRPGSGVTTAPTTGDPLASEALEVLRLTNVERAKAGCTPLHSNAALTTAARQHTVWQAKNGMSHTGEGGSTPSSRATDAGYRWRSVGENVAMGYTSASAVMDGWMNSSGHRANILNCGYRDIGIGVVRGSQGLAWTQLFGSTG